MNNDMHDILFVGPISPPITGPGVKNQALVAALRSNGYSLQVLNTLGWTSAAAARVLELWRNAPRAGAIVLSVSTNGRMVLLFLLRVIFFIRGIHRPIMLLAAGGSLGAELRRLAAPLQATYRGLLRACEGIYVETNSLKTELERLGLDNVTLMRNPRGRATVRWRREEQTSGRYKVLFLSKIKESKGALVLLEAVRKLRERGLDVSVDYYGLIEPRFEETFRRAVAGAQFAHYGGSVEPERVTAVMASYAAFVFPSYYSGEGLPGVLVEAAMVGIPVISTRFPASLEILSHEQNALLVEPRDVEALANQIERVLTDSALAAALSHGISAVAEEFAIDNIVQSFSIDLRENGVSTPAHQISF